MKVYISATLRSFFGRNSEFDLEQNTIKDILQPESLECPL